MKNLIVILCCGLIGLTGCTGPLKSVKYNDRLYAETNPIDIKIFEFLPKDIEAQYEPIGEIHSVQNKEQKLREEAAKMGGDVIVLKVTRTPIGVNKYGGVANRVDQSCLVLRRK